MKTAKTFEKLLWLVPVEVSFLENFFPREREQATWRDDQGIEIKILEFLLGKKLFETQKRTVKRRHNNSEPGIAITILHPAIYVPEPHSTITWRGRAVGWVNRSPEPTFPTFLLQNTANRSQEKQLKTSQLEGTPA